MENFFTNLKGQKTHGLDFYYYVKLKNDNDFQLIDYNRIEIDKGNIVQHQFSWIELDKLMSSKILPLEIRKIIKESEISFHMIINN